MPMVPNEQPADGRGSGILRRLQRYIFLASCLFGLIGAACLAVAVLMLAGLGGLIGADQAGEAVGTTVLTLAQAVFYLLLCALGIRCSRDRFKVKPFLALAAILATAIAVEQLMSSRDVLASAFLGGRFGILYLLFCVISFLSAIVAAALVGYNLQHPDGPVRA